MSYADTKFSPNSRLLEIFWNGKVVLNCFLGKSMDGFHHVPKPTSKSWTSTRLDFQWKDMGCLKMKELNVSKNVDCFEVSWQPENDDFVPVDVIDLNGAHWYGGAEAYVQKWPSSEQSMSMRHFVVEDYLYMKEQSVYGNILEPFWISSTGVGIYVDECTPLHVAFNENDSKQLELKAEYRMSKYKNINNTLPVLKYTICVGKDIKCVWQNMMKMFYKPPLSTVDEAMVIAPVWSTWARYKTNVNQSSVLEYAEQINSNGFPKCQIEIDDMYTSQYGEFDFDENKFPEAKEMIQVLHTMGFRVTTWVHPFANLDSAAFLEGKMEGYFVKDQNGKEPAIVTWWQGKGGILDVTNEAARNWFTRRLKNFQMEYKLDSFKFDAGETNWLPDDIVTEQPLMNPCEYTKKYVEMVAAFGTMAETRVGYKTQRYPLFVRIMDKDSRWGYDNGLKSMIPTALLMGILGYPFILPDMIGGNAYDANDFSKTVLPSKELYIRWAQLSAYLPSMQFSIAPWQYDAETVAICKKATVEHEKIVAPLIMSSIEETLNFGIPIIRPLWWIDPSDTTAQTIDSEFLVGNTLLVAPILEDGARSRDIYLPRGVWNDCLRGGKLQGGRWYKSYAIELHEVATFKLNV